MRRVRHRQIGAVWLWMCGVGPLLALLAPASLASVEGLPPSPYEILNSQHLKTPVLDAVPACVPAALDPALDPVLEEAEARDWTSARALLRTWIRGLDHAAPELVLLDAVLEARAASSREERRVAEQRFAELLVRREFRARPYCARVERARLLLMMSRESEAAAQLARARSWLDEQAPGETARRTELDFLDAEILFQTGQAFDAHLAFRKLSHAVEPRLALAARLRLTDLSFDAGRVEQVSDEYEALLPRASAFGASTRGWALRASEAALDAGEPDRALHWLDRFAESSPDRGIWEASEIRRADLDVHYEDVQKARGRLASVSRRSERDPTGALAAIRSIDLGVAQSSPEQRLDLLLMTIRNQRGGVRRYALDVLMDQLASSGDLDGALAVATRLAYEGFDPAVTPDFAPRLDALLERAIRGARDAEGCRNIVNALGGRFGILIERATRLDAFVVVGECFEKMELPWLATRLYRSIARRFGSAGAERIALPLARVSLSVGDAAMARRVASAAIEDAKDDALVWRAVLAEADFVEGRTQEGVRGIRRALTPMKEPDVLLRASRGRLLRLLATTLESEPDPENVDFIAARAPVWLAEGDPAPRAHAALVEATLLAAHAYRQAGRIEESNKLYRVVDVQAEEGALRSSARFWLGLAGAERGDGGIAWGTRPEQELDAPWARYAQFERRLGGLIAAYGEGQ